MDKYLKQVASYLYKKKGDTLTQTTIVFPNRRSGLFFQKYLSSILEHPIFSPEIITISDLVRRIADLRPVDPTIAIIELFNVYKEITKSKEQIDDFFFWGEILISDFNDIDKYLIDAQKLFRNIISLKEIDNDFSFLSEEQWNFLSSFWKNILNSKESDNKKEFLTLWKDLYAIYEKFNASLKAKGLASDGQLYRQAFLNMENAFADDDKQYIFIGFNALNVCEKKIFSHLKNSHHGLFFWDYDEYYISKPHHEASTFMRDNLANYPMPNDFAADYNNFENIQNMEVVAVPCFMGQASLSTQWSQEIELQKNEAFDSSAIILCDESLLIPIMNNISDSVETMNVTMGYPIKDSSVFSLIKLISELDKNTRTKNDTVCFYYKTVLSLLNHPLLKPHLGESIAQIENRIKKENRIYLTLKDLECDPLAQHIFELPKEQEQCKKYLQHILLTLLELSKEEEIISKECLYQCYLALNRLDEILSGQEIPKKLFYQLLIKSLERLSIPFEGEPLSGLQIMGFLETRCLDFDNLLILSMNDNKLPGTVSSHSFIPYSLRQGFGLPSIEQKNAMYAYHFYRLIQRAKNVTMAYDSRSESFGGGEMSRYIIQLKYEAPFANLKFAQGKFSFSPMASAPIKVDKNKDLLKKTIDFLTMRDKPLSPSALSTYLSCTLKFYFNYIENVHESDDVLEEIDQIGFGKIAHKTLEIIYSEMIGKNITREYIQNILSNEIYINKCLSEAMKTEFFKGGDIELIGQNVLIHDIILKYIKRILKYDMEKTVPFTIMSLETKYETSINIKNGEDDLSIRIGGIIDRLDVKNGRIRVVDYKTGKAEGKITSIEDLFNPQKGNKPAFQTLLYSMAVAETIKDPNTIIEPAVYGASSVFCEDFDPYFRINDDQINYNAQSEIFKTNLKKLLSEIIDPGLPFQQIEKDSRTCSFCPYKKMCNK